MPSITIDTAAPNVLSSTFSFATSHALTYSFNENVGPTVAAGDLASETETMARRLAQGAPIAMGRIKSLLRSSWDRPFEAQLDAEGDSFGVCAVTEDFSGAVDAFFEKRKPQFHGR